MEYEAQFELARQQLTAFMPFMAKTEAPRCWPVGINPHWKAVSFDREQTYNDVVGYYADHRQGASMLVSADHNENTIYLNPEANLWFRYWHDCTHVRCRKDFSYTDEYMVALHHVHCVGEFYGFDSPAAKLMRIDTLGQLKYFANKGKHVDNQLEFARSQW